MAELPQIEERLNNTVEEFKGNGHIFGVVVKYLKSGQVDHLNPDGVFGFIGLKPNTDFLKEAIELDRWEFITTEKTLQTSVPGIFATWDVREAAPSKLLQPPGKGPPPR